MIKESDNNVKIVIVLDRLDSLHGQVFNELF
jgi:hypothetical protein